MRIEYTNFIVGCLAGKLVGNYLSARNPQNDGHLDQLLVAISLFGIRATKKPHGNP